MSTRVTKHASPALLKRGVRGVTGEPLEIIMHLPTAPALSVTGFASGSAFPDAAFLASLNELVRAVARRHDVRLMLFGHADAVGSEPNNKVLSDRRAQVTLALLTQDVKQFDRVAQDDQWSPAQYLSMLSALGLEVRAAESKHDRPEEARAVLTFQRAYNRGVFHLSSLRERAHCEVRVDGVLGPNTRAAVRDAYVASTGASLHAKRFVGPKAVGCSHFNLSGAGATSRRVSLALYGTNFPTESRIPCRLGDASSCKVNPRARHPFKCNFYRRTLEGESIVEGNVGPGPGGALSTVFVRDQLAHAAKVTSKELFIDWLRSVFGQEVPQARYELLRNGLLDESLPHPPVVLSAHGPDGHMGAFNRKTASIEVSNRLAWRAALGDDEAGWLLLAVLIEEFGHYLDEWLREGVGDAPWDEGARFGWAMVNLDTYERTRSEIAVLLHGSGSEYPITANLSQLRKEVDVVFSEEAQRSDAKSGSREYFGPQPTAPRLSAGVKAALALLPAERVAKMNELGKRFGVPENGWDTGQSRIFVGDDVRLTALLRMLAKGKSSANAAVNLERAARYFPDIDPYLVLSTASREGSGAAVTALGDKMIETWEQGGLDFLWTNRNKLGLPASVTSRWREPESYKSPETGEDVHPGLIPESDQVLAYAAQTNQSFANFVKRAQNELENDREKSAMSALSSDARSVWQAYAFISPGGDRVPPGRPPKHGRGFGVWSALTYLDNKATAEGRALDANAILTDATLHPTDSVRIAKARALEAAFIGFYVDQASDGAP